MLKKESQKHTSNSLEKARTGITGFDAITRGGLPKARPTLLRGGSGCGKTIFAVEFLVHGVEQFDEAGVFISFEETPSDLAKNVASLLQRRPYCDPLRGGIVIQCAA